MHRPDGCVLTAVHRCQTAAYALTAEVEAMMENKTFRWIAFAVSAVLAVIAIFAHTFSGFLCFAVAAFR